jgi:hypothetical protein
MGIQASLASRSECPLRNTLPLICSCSPIIAPLAQDQSPADQRPIASFPRLWCYRLIATDLIRRVQRKFC